MLLKPVLGIAFGAAFVALLVFVLVKADSDERRKMEAGGGKWIRSYKLLLPGMKVLFKNKVVFALAVVALALIVLSLIGPLIRKLE